MAESIVPISVASNTWNDLISAVNNTITVISNRAVTVNTYSGGAVTVGNAYVNGIFSANVVAVKGALRGGNVGTNTVLTIDTSGFVVNTALYTSGIATTSELTANQIVDAYDYSVYRTSKYLVQITSVSGYHSSEIVMTHDGTSGYVTEYAVLTTAGNLGIFSSNVAGSNVNLLFTPTVDAITAINFQRTSLAI